jgi:hypothetical protein
MTIDTILLYSGLAAGIGMIAYLLPGYFKKLLNEPPKQAKILLR